MSFGDPSTRASRDGSRAPAVLQLLPRLVSGGVERGTVDVAAALAAAGWRSFVASAGGPMAAEIARAGATHIELPLASKNPIVMRRNVGRLVALIERLGIDIVHARSRAPAWSGWAAARRSRARFITTFHNVYGGETRLKLWYNSVMAKGERVIAISEFVGEHARRVYAVPPDKLHVIPRGVDLARFDPARVAPDRLVDLAAAWRLDDGRKVILLPGRITRWKGQLDLVDAVARLGRSDVDVVLVGSADGREGFRREVERRIGEAGLAGTVRILDACADMPAAYMLADLVVSASNEPEGFGRVAVEAQAMGRPVIATDHGGSRETVLPGETGWLVPPAHAGRLAAAIAEALSLGAAERVALGERAMAHVRRSFTKEAMCERTLAVYQEVLAMARAEAA
jgi:glycosyltransferase involved in cell wall biosynthesis